MTDRPSSRDAHRIVVVGGGAAGLELVTRLGDTPASAVPYDTLVIAVGSVTNDFGTPVRRGTRCRWRLLTRPRASIAGW